MDSKSIDIVLISFFLIFAIYSGIKFFYENPFLDNLNGSEYVASISGQENTVKRKKKDFLSWFDATVGDKLEINDQIYTHEKSHVKINFSDESKVDLAENTLFKISNLNKKTNLILEKGIMQASITGENNKFNLDFNGKKYELLSKNAKIQIEKNDKKERMIMLDGEIQISGGNKKKVLKKNQYLEYDKKTQKEKISYLEIIPQHPENGSEIFYIKKGSVNFSWKSTKGHKNFTFILARDSSFKSLIWRGNIKENKKKINDLLEGTYYWKVKKGDFDSGVRFFTMTHNTPPEISYPLPGSIFSLQKNGDNDYVVLSWKGKDQDSFLLELSTPEGIKKTDVTNNKYVLNSPSDGRHEFRVRIKDEKRDHALWSDRVVFFVDRRSPPPPPNIIAPTDNSHITFYRDDKMKVNLVWFPVRNISYYHVVLKKEGGVVFDDKVTGNKLELALDEGSYSWKVRTVDIKNEKSGEDWQKDNQKTTKYSKMQNFIIKTMKGIFFPTDGSRIILLRPNQKIEIKWNLGRPNKNYTLEMSKQIDFKVVDFSKNTNENFAKIPFKDLGTYFWRVKVTTPKDKTFYTKTIKMILDAENPPEKPEISPEIELKINFKKKNRNTFIDWFINTAYAEDLVKFVKIKWKSRENISKYILEIYKDKKMKKRILQKDIAKPSFDFENVNEGEVYYWRLAVVDHWKRKSPFSDLSLLIIKDEGVKKEKITTNLSSSSDKKKTSSPNKTLFVPKAKHLSRKNINVFYGPVKLDYELTSEMFTTKLDGLVLNSFLVSGRSYSREKKTNDWAVGYQAGEVLNGIGYSSFHVEYLMGYPYKWFNFPEIRHKVGVMFQISSVYKFLSFLELEEKKGLFFSLLAGLEYEYKIDNEWNSLYGISFGLGGMTLIDLNVLFKYSFNKKISYDGGLKLKKKTYSSDYGDLSELDLQFIVGMSYSYY